MKILTQFAIIVFFVSSLWGCASMPPATVETPGVRISTTSEEGYDPYLPFIAEQVPIKYMRVAIHVFQHPSGEDSFHDRPADRQFLETTINRVNRLLTNLAPMKPENSPDITTSYIPDARIQLHLDTIYFWADEYVHEYFSRDGIVRPAAAYAYDEYVINNPALNEIQKHNTLHLIISGTHNTSGGQVSGIGDKRFILFKGWYHRFSNGVPHANYRNFVHELGHSCGLIHHFAPHNCRQCQDLGCYPQGATNNIMDLWPSDWESISECQIRIMHQYLDGKRGNIGDVVMDTPPAEGL
jgi:hypothetical protein